MQKWIILIVICIILIITTVIVLNTDIETEYVPEAEISQTALRKTIVTLYYKNKENGEIIKESRLIDSKSLLKDPYQELMVLLISGPENQNYERAIPEVTNILETSFENSCVSINFNKEFIENSKDEIQRKDAIYTIYKTLTELTEVISIKILIEGEEREEINTLISNIQNNIQENIDNTNKTINSEDTNNNFTNVTLENTL